MFLVLFVNNIITASDSNKNKIKIKDLTTKELLGEQPFYSSYIDKRNSRNQILKNYWVNNLFIVVILKNQNLEI